MIISDFRCPHHGLFEAMTHSSDEYAACPSCGARSAWSPSPVFGQVELVTATRGKSDAMPHPMATDLREVGEGRKLSDWRKERKKQWADHDYKIRKERNS